MFFQSLFALIPILAAGSTATAVPRMDNFFGRIHPIDHDDLCIAASHPSAGARVGLTKCHVAGSTASALEQFNVTSVRPFEAKAIALREYPDLCIDGLSAREGGFITLQKCDIKISKCDQKSRIDSEDEDGK
ncbi:hypothetical protein IAU60_003833 [Kwoniella sp. DSM 27419]